MLTTTFVSSALLAGVFVMTKDSIANVGIKKINKGISNVLPKFDNNPSENVTGKFVDGDTVYIYAASKNGEPSGYAVQTFTNAGYGGKIVLMVGFLVDGTINNIEVISHSETPGLGDKIDSKKHSFSLQFNGKNPKDFKLSVRKNGGDVDAITATTISSKAFCNAVARAYAVFSEEILKTAVNGVSGATQTNNQQ